MVPLKVKDALPKMNSMELSPSFTSPEPVKVCGTRFIGRVVLSGSRRQIEQTAGVDRDIGESELRFA